MLQAEVEKKNQMLSEVKKHLREAAERERQLMAMSQDSQVECYCPHSFLNDIYLRVSLH